MLSQGSGLWGWELSGRGEDRLEERRQNRVRLLQGRWFGCCRKALNARVRP